MISRRGSLGMFGKMHKTRLSKYYRCLELLGIDYFKVFYIRQDKKVLIFCNDNNMQITGSGDINTREKVDYNNAFRSFYCSCVKGYKTGQILPWKELLPYEELQVLQLKGMLSGCHFILPYSLDNKGVSIYIFGSKTHDIDFSKKSYLLYAFTRYFSRAILATTPLDYKEYYGGFLCQKELYLCAKMLELVRRLNSFLPMEELSHSEFTVLRHIRDFQTEKELSAFLSISERALRYHIQNIKQKMGKNTLSEIKQLSKDSFPTEFTLI